VKGLHQTLTGGRVLGMTTTNNTELSVTQIMKGQIGTMNILAISGGRVIHHTDGNTLSLPVANGYRVEVEYLPVPDVYEVRRVYVRGLKRWVKGTVTNVYATQLGDVAYDASCFQNVEFGA